MFSHAFSALLPGGTDGKDCPGKGIETIIAAINKHKTAIQLFLSTPRSLSELNIWLYPRVLNFVAEPQEEETRSKQKQNTIRSTLNGKRKRRDDQSDVDSSISSRKGSRVPTFSQAIAVALQAFVQYNHPEPFKDPFYKPEEDLSDVSFSFPGSAQQRYISLYMFSKIALY